MIEIEYIESEIPLEEHKYSGWHYYYPTKKYYRWNDIPWEIEEENDNGES